MARQERREMGRNPNRPHPWPATAVRDAEGFVEIKMANIRPNIAGAAQTYLGIHISPIHVDLPAMLMHNLANLLDGFFKNPVGRRVGDHEGG
jgi:hypothetical protein